MATDEHKRLASLIKNVHESLRIMAKEKGPEAAWQEHLKDTSKLKDYALAMKTLAGIWEKNSQNLEQSVRSRISWIVDYCLAYFFTEQIYIHKRAKEQRILEANDVERDSTSELLQQMDAIRLLDVGSCYNPFESVANFEVTALDLCPAHPSVHRGDFLKVPTNSKGTIFKQSESTIQNEIESLPVGYFDCVVFSLLLEYIPSSDQRLACCQKAYDLLKTEGILIVITPDSQHVGKNAKIMKNWRYTFAKIGFSRIKFEKLTHITCMVFRKAICRKITDTWAEAHKKPYMEFRIDIPQDSNDF